MQPSWIINGLVYLADGPRRCDLRIENGRIAAVRNCAEPSGAVPPETTSARPPDPGPAPEDLVIDAGGLAVLPGFIDFHTHLDDRIGLFQLADTFASGSAAAIRTGITTLMGFVTQPAGQSLSGAVEKAVARGAGRSRCDYHFHLTPTRFEPADWAEIQQLVARGYRTFKFYTTYREAGLYTSYSQMAALMSRLGPLGARVLVHCEDQEILDEAAAAVTSKDLANPFAHTRLRPELAEVAAIAHVLKLAAETWCLTHVVHVSTAEGAELIRHARAAGTAVSAETAPQYLFLDDSRLAGTGGHRWICSPPLRPAQTRQTLAQLAAAGVFDLFATDHCAFRREDKDDWTNDLRAVPNGVAGVGALVPLVAELLLGDHSDGGSSGRFDDSISDGSNLPATTNGPTPEETALQQMARCLSANPARLAGLYPRKGVIAVGSDADLVVLDLNGPRRLVRSSDSDVYETYPDHATALNVRKVFLRGRQIVQDNAIVDPELYPGAALCK